MVNKFVELFLKNKGLKQTILKNTSWLILSEIIAGILGLALSVYVVRTLGAEEYGKFVFALSFVSIFSIITDLGVMNASTKEFSRDRRNEEKFPDIFTLQIALFILTLAVSILSSFFVTKDTYLFKLILVLSFFVSAQGFFWIVLAFLRARQKMEYEALIRVSQSVLTFLACFLAIFYSASALNVSYGYLFASLILILTILASFQRKFGLLKLSFDFKYWKSFLGSAWPLSLGFVASWLYIMINSVILGYSNLIIENGWYGAASKIALMVAIPAELLVRSFYPTLNNFFVSSKEKLNNAFEYFLSSMIVLAIPTVVGGIVMAPRIINLFYGSNFASSVFPFQLLIVVIGISFVSYPFAVGLIIAGSQRLNFFIIVTGAILNVILGFILLPMYGFYGAITTTIIISAIILFILIALFKYKTPILIDAKKIGKITVISIFSAALMYFIISYRLIYNLNVLIVCIIGVAIYTLLIFILHHFFIKNNSYAPKH